MVEGIRLFKLVAQKAVPTAPETIGQYADFDYACKTAIHLVKVEKYLEAKVFNPDGEALYTITNRTQ